MVDLKITITIKDSDINEFKTGFLKAIPKPTEYAHLTDVEFLKQYLEDALFRAYKTGKMKIAQETTLPIVTDNIVKIT